MNGPSAELRGEVFTNALPAEDPVLYGSASLSPGSVLALWVVPVRASRPW